MFGMRAMWLLIILCGLLTTGDLAQAEQAAYIASGRACCAAMQSGQNCTIATNQMCTCCHPKRVCSHVFHLHTVTCSCAEHLFPLSASAHNVLSAESGLVAVLPCTYACNLHDYGTADPQQFALRFDVGAYQQSPIVPPPR